MHNPPQNAGSPSGAPKPLRPDQLLSAMDEVLWMGGADHLRPLSEDPAPELPPAGGDGASVAARFPVSRYSRLQSSEGQRGFPGFGRSRPVQGRLGLGSQQQQQQGKQRSGCGAGQQGDPGFEDRNTCQGRRKDRQPNGGDRASASPAPTPAPPPRKPGFNDPDYPMAYGGKMTTRGEIERLARRDGVDDEGIKRIFGDKLKARMRGFTGKIRAKQGEFRESVAGARMDRDERDARIAEKSEKPPRRIKVRARSEGERKAEGPIQNWSSAKSLLDYVANLGPPRGEADVRDIKNNLKKVEFHRERAQAALDSAGVDHKLGFRPREEAMLDKLNSYLDQWDRGQQEEADRPRLSNEARTLLAAGRRVSAGDRTAAQNHPGAADLRRRAAERVVARERARQAAASGKGQAPQGSPAQAGGSKLQADRVRKGLVAKPAAPAPPPSDPYKAIGAFDTDRRLSQVFGSPDAEHAFALKSAGRELAALGRIDPHGRGAFMAHTQLSNLVGQYDALDDDGKRALIPQMRRLSLLAYAHEYLKDQADQQRQIGDRNEYGYRSGRGFYTGD